MHKVVATLSASASAPDRRQRPAQPMGLSPEQVRDPSSSLGEDPQDSWSAARTRGRPGLTRVPSHHLLGAMRYFSPVAWRV